MFLIRLRRDAKVADEVVAYGVAFHNGHAVLQWRNTAPTLTIYSSVSELTKVETRDGKSRVEVFSEAVPMWKEYTPLDNREF